MSLEFMLNLWHTHPWGHTHNGPNPKLSLVSPTHKIILQLSETFPNLFENIFVIVSNKAKVFLGLMYILVL